MPRRIAPHLPSVRAFVPSQLEGDRLVTGLSRSKMLHSIFWLNAGPWAKELTLLFKFGLVRVVALKVTASLSADLQSLRHSLKGTPLGLGEREKKNNRVISNMNME